MPQGELRTDPHVTTQDSASGTPQDAHDLHAWPDAPPEVDEPITVAVMDSGIHANAAEDHPWFHHADVTERYDAVGSMPGADKVGHGTGVASIIARNAATTVANETDLAAPVEFYDVRIFGEEGRTGRDVIRDAYEWLIDHADEIDIVNMSWGAQSDVPEINQLHEKLVNKGVHDVVAAGNTGGEGGSPSTSKKAFSAGAVDADGDLTRFTSRDPNQDNPDVAALGKNVKMARAPGTAMGRPLDDEYVKASGTSFAAPYTTAGYVLALFKQQQSWDADFERHAKDIPGTKADGEGLLKVRPAIPREDTDGGDAPEESPDSPAEPSYPKADASVWSFLGSDTMFLSADWLPDGSTTVEKVEESKDAVTLRVKK